MDNMKRARRPHRTEATRLATELTTLLEAPEKDRRKIRTKVKLLLETKEKLMDLDEKILNQLVEDQAEEKVEEEETKTTREYREKIENILDQAEEIIQLTRPRSPTPSDSASNAEKKRNFKLPVIELKRYNGDLKEWLGFWSQFEKIHEDETLHSSDKFQYLLQAMEKGTPARELVESYPQTGENYEKAVEALKDRFGNKDILLQVYVRELLKLVISNVTNKERIPLTTLYIKLESHLRSLGTLNLTMADPATWLFPLVESSLDTDTLRTWQRSPQIKMEYQGKDSKTRLDLLMEFLKNEVQIEQRIQVVETGFQQKPAEFKRPPDKPTMIQKRKRNWEENLPTAAGLFATQEVVCIFCEGNHDSKSCIRAKSMTLEEKQTKMKSKGACFSCLKTGHMKKKCRGFVSCHLCPKKHATIICPLLHQTGNQDATGNERQNIGNQQGPMPQVFPTPSSQQRNQAPQFSTTAQQCSVDCAGDILLMTMWVNVSRGADLPSVRMRLMIDNGCQRSSIRKSAVRKIGSRPIGSEMTRSVLFDASITKFAKTNIHKVTISGLDGKHSLKLVLRERPQLGGGIPLVPVGPWMEKLKQEGIWLSDTRDKVDKEEIEIVIGSDFWWRVKTGNELKLTEDLGVTETLFGWALSGMLPRTETYGETSVTMFQMQNNISDLWNMEVIGIKDPITTLSKAEEELAALEIFRQTTSRQDDGRYVVKLPWVNGPQALPTNRKIAEQRLISTTRKLERMGHYEAYDKIFMDWLAEDFIEIIQDPQVMEEKSKCHYVCHHPVFKDSPTTPTRPVFDASCKSGRYPSLNNCLYKGPNFIEKLPTVMMKFRIGSLGVVSDIRKAFQMIVVEVADRDYLRFLWWDRKNGRIIVFRHKRVMFGANCSPFLLAAVLELHLNSVVERKDIAMKITESMYVDNVVTSVNSYEEYADFRTEAVRIMDQAKMDLRQWETTIGNGSGVSPLSSEIGCGLEQGKSEGINNASTKVLGMIWNKVEDTLSISLPDQIDTTFTKRGILSAVSKIFDPIGYSCPAVFTGKVLFQNAWRSKTDWDCELDGKIRDEFLEWIKQVPVLKDIQIPRHHQIPQATTHELHLFCDGSQLGYACVVYLKTQVDDQVMVQLIQAKSRVAPLEKATIPRMELCACLIGARLMHSVKVALDLHEVPTYLWSDSTTAIAWIRKNDDWGTYVGNRVKQILEVTKPEDWRHVAGIRNPADLPSRGCSPVELVRSRWWEGPTWLKEESPPYTSSGEPCDEELVNSERKKTSVNMMEGTANCWFVPKFSSYLKNVRVLGWIRRFIRNARKQGAVKLDHLEVCEIKQAEREMIKIIQDDFYGLEPKIKSIPVVRTEDGLLRVKTALTAKKDDTADFVWPILLPGKHPLVDMLIREAHLTYGHVGTQRLMGILRERFWITQTRKTAAKVISKCVICQRYNVKACEVESAPLPPTRVTTGEAFTTVGVDLAGPLFIKDKGKVWIVLYTCAVYRGLYLDLVTSLDTMAFLQSLERFISSHGRPHTLYSDNGTNFVGASNLFKSMKWDDIERESGVKQIRWIFNPPTASWWGGFLERLVKSVKDLLRRMLGRSKLDFEQLRTCLAAVASAINERPLTTITEDPNDFKPLTPDVKCLLRVPEDQHFRRVKTSLKLIYGVNMQR